MNDVKDKKFEDNKASTEESELLDRIRYRTKGPSAKYSAENSFRRLWERIQQSSEKKKPRLLLWKYAAVAATLALLLTVSYRNIRHQTESKTTATHELVASNGRQQFTLPDGSSVWLNVGSQLSYTDDFGSKTREITLIGEAYFEVRHDAERPFTVNVCRSSVRVLGTKFNLRAYPDEQEIVTTLVEGSVKFNKNQSDIQGPTLRAGQQLSFDMENQSAVINEVNCEQYIAWKDGKLLFRQSTVEEAFKRMERAFGIKFVVEGSMLTDKRRITGTFSLDDTPISILKVMVEGLLFEYDMKTDTVFIK
ncbi:MAG: FecR domain-containing protein [Prevotellaceae bacterium]|jgi:ferric-dicitrate binding protein FerR (iron transport regulator)|nr:FecR domain-containing protein [Prevotellaceae bacterium]